MANYSVEGMYPLSQLQEGMLFHAVSATGSDAYIVQVQFSFGGTLNVAAFEEAWQRVIRHHPALRTGFEWRRDGRPMQVAYDQIVCPLGIENWGDVSPRERELRLVRFLERAPAVPIEEAD